MEPFMTLPNPLVSSRREYLGGTPCFHGTRVPVKSLFDYLARGHSLDYFLEQFPSVEREHAIAVLDEAGARTVSEAQAA
jgi:uncharacterized protein (DUF433 family)